MYARELQYEIDELILFGSGYEDEIPFIFMDGIAIQIENPIPVKSPIILTNPQKK